MQGIKGQDWIKGFRQGFQETLPKVAKPMGTPADIAYADKIRRITNAIRKDGITPKNIDKILATELDDQALMGLTGKTRAELKKMKTDGFAVNRLNFTDDLGAEDIVHAEPINETQVPQFQGLDVSAPGGSTDNARRMQLQQMRARLNAMSDDEFRTAMQGGNGGPTAEERRAMAWEAAQEVAERGGVPNPPDVIDLSDVNFQNFTPRQSGQANPHFSGYQIEAPQDNLGLNLGERAEFDFSSLRRRWLKSPEFGQGKKWGSVAAKPFRSRKLIPQETGYTNMSDSHLESLFDPGGANKKIAKAMQSFKDAPKGIHNASSSLSDSSLPLYLSKVAQLNKMFPNNTRPWFTGYNTLNHAGNLRSAGMDAQDIANYLNTKISGLSFGGKKLPRVRVKGESIEYPNIVIEKFQKGGTPLK